jgi:zinc protease
LAPRASLEQVKDIIQQELQMFLKDGPGLDELERAKTKINAGVIRGLERVGGFHGKASTLAQSELYDGNPDFYKTALSWIGNATAAEVQEAAKRWLSGGLYQLDVLPYGDHQVSSKGVDRTAGLPAVNDLPELRFPDIQRASLSNGMSVVLAERTAIPVVSLSLQFDAGYAADAGLKLGTASFTLAMMDESTRSRSALEIDKEAESLGAEISTTSDLDTSRASLSALNENLEPSIGLFADVIRNPAFTSEEMERLRVRWLAMIEQEKTQPVSVALRTLPPLIYGEGHAYGIPFTGNGTEDSITELARDDLVKFHNDWIRPDNATLFVVGDTSLGEIMPVLEENFGDWKAPRSTMLIIIDKPDSPQSLLLAAHLAPPTGVENNIAILMMNDILGGKYSARVNQNLRVDKQWSYGAFTFLQDARGQRPWLVYAPVQSDRTAESLIELMNEFNRFINTEPATPEELTRVFRSSAFSLPGRYETSAAVLGALQANDRFGRPDDYVASLKGMYEAVSLENVHGAAEQVLHPDRITWVVVGNRAQIEGSLMDLGIAELEFMDSDGNPVE